MPTSNLPPIPSQPGFDQARSDYADILRRIVAGEEGTDTAFLLDWCKSVRLLWRERAELFVEDNGFPAKRLTVEQRQAKRSVEALDLGRRDIQEFVAWCDAVIEALSLHLNLRRARAA